MSSSTLVLIGAAGWQHPAWRGRFYPDDMPDDWLLSYYNSQFSAVYLPASAVWQAASGTLWAQWLYDTRDGFYFVLEGEAGPALPASERIVMATPAWEAEHVWWLDEAPDLRVLAQRISRQASTGEPLFVFSRSGNLDLMEQAKTLVQVMGY